MAGVSEPLALREARAADAAVVAAIYNPYVTETAVTFEEDPVSPDEIARRMDAVQAAGLPWMVAEHNGRVVGYAYATPWKSRRGYRFSVESTVYVERSLVRRGIGLRLYSNLFARLRTCGCHAVIGGIVLPNEASVALHEKVGMTKVAEFPEVGTKFGRWVSVGYWQRILSSDDAA